MVGTVGVLIDNKWAYSRCVGKVNTFNSINYKVLSYVKSGRCWCDGCTCWSGRYNNIW